MQTANTSDFSVALSISWVDKTDGADDCGDPKYHQWSNQVGTTDKIIHQ
jgi:hypothetical protein